jgi:hypothetical protein
MAKVEKFITLKKIHRNNADVFISHFKTTLFCESVHRLYERGLWHKPG